MAEIKMSIIVPAYNAEKYLERCLDSLVNQDLSTKEYEVIVINDGSQIELELFYMNIPIVILIFIANSRK